jgi:ribonuclease BN (tRNA processing enzyme)
MRIVFFGSSHGVPEPNRRCSSTMIECGESRYFIDMGTQSMEQLITRRIPIETVKSVFITHMHGDHTDGLISFIDLCNWKFKNVHPKFYLPTDTEKAKAAINSWLTCNGLSMREFDFIQVNEGLLYDDGIIRITAFRTLHINESYAYLVEAEGKRVFFSGDMCHKGPAEDFPISIFDDTIDLAICESAHFDATDFLPIFKGRENLKKVCFNHYSDRFLESVMEATRLLPDLKVIKATDDLEITV